MSFKKLFLPVGLLLAIAIAFAAPTCGAWMREHGFIPVFVIVIFLVSGWRLNMKEAKLNRKFIYALLIAMAISLIGGPFLAMAAVKMFGLTGMLALGLIVMSCGPVTLSSATVITDLAKGNAVWALFMTVIMNIVGIFSIPLMLQFTLREAEGVNIAPGKLLFKLILLVLLPFIVGVIAKKAFKAKPEAITGYIPSLCVILTVYAAFSVSKDLLGSNSFFDIFILIAAAAFIHFSLMIAAWFAGKSISSGPAELKALAFVSSQKTLPIAISVLAILCDNPGVAIIPCLIFHLTQLFADSAIASHMATSGEVCSKQ